MGNLTWKIEWSDALSMANPELDADHRQYIALVNELNGAIIDQQRNKADIERILTLILEHTIVHFSHEEKLFIENGYPGAQKHAQTHSALISKLNQALKDIQNTGFSRQWVELSLAVKSLLVNHIVNDDTRYIEYLRTK